uniref:PiggyBac transposable element-derived protein domain-containing protein n=1 Tax=Branchiostoma floridae TaxID=7739 RepID=C3YH29_BRAFL|eukprot:XP_002604489.1 hypothetical protein BRAFLDRAFT_79210 [Branchiostoma floridae]
MSQSDDDDEDSEEMGDADEDGVGSADDGGWTADVTHFDPPCFSDGETVGPVRDVTPDTRPIDFFHLLVPEPVLSAIVQQTNRYAHKYQLKNGRDEEWRNVDLAEMKAFMAIFMYTSLVHGVFSEDISALWEVDEITYNPVMASILTQRRFQRIMRYFHVVSSSGQQQGDSLRKIRPFLEAVQNSFRNEFKTAQTHVIHEPPLEEEPLMWSRRLDRKRRKKKRFNLWVRQCTATGFISQCTATGFISQCTATGFISQVSCLCSSMFTVHSYRLHLTGELSVCSSMFNVQSPIQEWVPKYKIHIHVKEKSDSLSHHEKGYSVARDLCSDLIGSGRNHIVFCIPAHTSLRLFRELESHGVYGCGVVTDARHTDWRDPRQRSRQASHIPAQMVSPPAFSPSLRHPCANGIPASVLAKPPASLRKYDSIVRTKGSVLAKPPTSLRKYDSIVRTKGSIPANVLAKRPASLRKYDNIVHTKGRLLTNAFSPAAQGKLVVKKNRRPDEERPCLEAVQAFQVHPISARSRSTVLLHVMCSSNHIKYIDKYNEKYSWYIISYKPSKTWQQLFWTVLSLAMNNAYVMYKLSPAHAHSRLSRSDFGAELLRAMAGPYYQEPPTQGEE